MFLGEDHEKTPLYDRHVALGAKLIDFGGWAMPVQYTSVVEEHHATRTKAGLFDICHMGEIDVRGPQAFALFATGDEPQSGKTDHRPD